MLKYDDIGHLEKFGTFLKSTHTISSNTTRCSFEFTHPHMRDMLELNFNIVPNKTFKLKFAKHIPDNWLRHYIRGYFDGDGSICESFSNKTLCKLLYMLLFAVVLKLLAMICLIIYKIH